MGVVKRSGLWLGECGVGRYYRAYTRDVNTIKAFWLIWFDFDANLILSWSI
jgi:hypothetical protein